MGNSPPKNNFSHRLNKFKPDKFFDINSLFLFFTYTFKISCTKRKLIIFQRLFNNSNYKNKCFFHFKHLKIFSWLFNLFLQKMRDSSLFL